MNESQWEPLAEVDLHFVAPQEEIEVADVYCLCSRVFIRNENKNSDFVNTDNELIEDDFGSKKKKLVEQFSPKTGKDIENPVSCYCSASHTDNISADEHDSLRSAPILSRGLQSSDSGADLSETFVAEETWEQYWAHNGEKLIWTSWINKYSSCLKSEEETKFSFEQNDIKKISLSDSKSDDLEAYTNKKIIDGWNPLSPASVDGQCHQNHQEKELLLTARSYSLSSVANTRATTDSMTNVTKLTLSSLDLSSSSSSISESLSPVQSSLSSSRSSESDYDPGTQVDADQHWQNLWKQHFEEQYYDHYAKFIKNKEKFMGETAEGLRKKGSLHSIGNLITQLKVMDETDESVTIREGEITTLPQIENKQSSTSPKPIENDDKAQTVEEQLRELGLPTSFGPHTIKDEKPELKSSILKRSHESDSEETNGTYKNRLSGAFSLMGYVWSPNDSDTVSGDVAFRKRHIRLQNRQLKMKHTPNSAKHIYFNDEGDPIVDTLEKVKSFLNKDNDHVLPIELESSSDEENELKNRTQLKKSSCDDCTKPQYIPPIENIENIVTRSRKFMEERGIAIPKEEVDRSSDCDSNSLKHKGKKKRKRSKKNLSTPMPTVVIENPELRKYWHKRFQLFSRFDSGIMLDYESWFSVTPERVAKYIADRCQCNIIVDAFCGAGGNTIQFAQVCEKVIAIDIDPEKIKLAKHNAEIYGVEKRIEFMVGDYTKIFGKLQADCVFLSPPWGGPSYLKTEKYDLETMLEPIPLSELLAKTRKITPNIALFVPRNSNVNQLAICAGHDGKVEVEQNFLDKSFVSITAFYGNLINCSS